MNNRVLSNKVENSIVNLLSNSFPLKANEIHKKLSSKDDVTYKYVSKSLSNLVERGIIKKSGLKYELNKKYIRELKDFIDVASKNYAINQNVFLDKINSNVLSILNKKDRDNIYDKLQEVLKDEIHQKLDEWYREYYDPERLEFKKIKQIAKLKDKKVLELGCGTGRITYNLAKFSNEVVAIDSDKEYIEFCEKLRIKDNIDNLRFIHKDIKNIETLKEKFDVIVSGWVGLHYDKNVDKTIQKLHKLLKKDGVLIIIEAYPETDYIRLLNMVTDRSHIDYTNLHKKLKDSMFDTFKDLKEEMVKTKYVFPSIEKLEETIKIELVYEEGVNWTSKEEAKLKKAIKTLKNPLNLEEPPLFFISRKK